MFQPVVFDAVRNLKPVDGGLVYGEAEYSFRSASNIDGKTIEDAAGHKVINADGKVKEFDFTPKTDLLPLVSLFFLILGFNRQMRCDYVILKSNIMEEVKYLHNELVQAIRGGQFISVHVSHYFNKNHELRDDI